MEDKGSSDQEHSWSAKNLTPPALWKNFSWTFVGNLIYVMSQWGMLVVLAKLGNPNMVGQFALALAVTAPVVILFNLALRQVQATDARKHYAFSEYLALRIITTSAALLVIVGIVFVTGYRWETSLVILMIGLAKGFESLSDVLYGQLQQRERMDRIAKSMMIKGPSSLAALALGIYLTGSVFWGAVGLTIVWALLLVSYDFRSIVRVLVPIGSRTLAALRPKWDFKALAKLTWLALPLGFAAALVSLNTGIPRYLIEYYLGEREVGIFASVAYIMVAGNVVVGALGQSSVPRLARYHVNGNHRAFGNLLLKLATVGVLLGIAGVLVSILAGRWILTLLYTPEYAEYTNVFIVIMVAAGLSYVASLLKFGITAARYFRVQIPLFIGSVIVTTIACVVLVPQAGVLGAAIAAALGIAFQLAGTSGILIYAISDIRRKPSE